MNFRKMKRWCLAFVLGAMVVVLCAFDSPISNGELLFTIPILHHHSDACLGPVTLRQSADTESLLTKSGEDVCSLCGAAHHYYSFYATCSCGKEWNRSGHACYNSAYGTNPQGGCPNYSVVDFNTVHDHTCEMQICEKTEETVMGNLMIYISDTEPAEEVTLTATYEGVLMPPSMVWEEEKEPPKEPEEEYPEEEPEIEEDEKPDEEPETGEDEKPDEEPAGEGEEEEEESGQGTEPDIGIEPESEPEGTLTSSISVRKNGIFTLSATYFEDGAKFRISRSVTVSNIVKKQPALSKPEPAPAAEEPEISEPEEEEAEEPEQIFPLQEPDGPEEESVEEVSEEPEEPSEPESALPEGIVKGAFGVKIPETIPEEKEEKGGLIKLFLSLPKEVQAVGISVLFLLGLAGVVYGIFLLTSVAGVYWVDEKNRKHYFCGALLKRWCTGYKIRVRKTELLHAKSEEILVLIPKLVAKLHRYQPLLVNFGEKQYSLHVERKLKLVLS